MFIMNTQIDSKKNEEMNDGSVYRKAGDQIHKKIVVEEDKINHKTVFIQYKAEGQKDVGLDEEI